MGVEGPYIDPAYFNLTDEPSNKVPINTLFNARLFKAG